MSLSHQPQFSESNAFPPSLSLVITWIKYTGQCEKGSNFYLQKYVWGPARSKKKENNSWITGKYDSQQFPAAGMFSCPQDRVGLWLQEDEGWRRLLSHWTFAHGPRSTTPISKVICLSNLLLGTFCNKQEKYLSPCLD